MIYVLDTNVVSELMRPEPHPTVHQPVAGLTQLVTPTSTHVLVLHDRELDHIAQPQEATALKADIGIGLADVATRRVQDFDVARIIERGRKLSADRSAAA